jgi:hypothetical protein
LQGYPDQLSARKLNDILTDEQKTLALFREMVNQLHSDDGDEMSLAETELAVVARGVTREITTSGGEANLSQVFASAESPIEQAFLNSFLFKMTLEDLLNVVVFGPVDDLEAHIDGAISEYNGFVDWLTGFFHFKGARSLQDAYEELDFWRKTGRMPDASYYRAHQMLAADGLVDFVNSFHVMIQPTMKLDGKTIRPDLAVWVPADPSIKIIAECDGFAFHSDKQSFQRDRIRDRRLMEIGFRVRRYSGPEIFANPIAAGRDLADYLFALPRARRPKLLEDVQNQVRSLEQDS